jgi:soluble P-type ATPase
MSLNTVIETTYKLANSKAGMITGGAIVGVGVFVASRVASAYLYRKASVLGAKIRNRKAAERTDDTAEVVEEIVRETHVGAAGKSGPTIVSSAA